MGFINPVLPDVDYGEWRTKTRAERIKPMVQHWGVAGFGAPDGVYLLYIAKIIGYIAGGLFFASLTPGIGAFWDFPDWWDEPVVFQKVVVWTLLFEVLGFGCGFGPLTLRFLPPLGAFLHWLRPGTIRMPPWPGKVPFTSGSRRSVVDVLLYAVVLAATLWILLAPANRSAGGLDAQVGMIEPSRFVPLLVLLPLLGLRDKMIFLAARSEVYLSAVVVFLLPGIDMIVAAKLVLVAIWWGAATSKLNRHFPNVVAVMLSNTPLVRSKAIKRRLHRGYPEDLRPGAVSRFLAHFGTAVEYLVPLVLFVSDGGTVTLVAAAIMVAFHLLILTSIPMGVPLEWNVYMMFGIAFLFVDKAQYGLADISNPLPVALVICALAAGVVLGNLFPNKISFLIGMRYYAGNWDTSMWLLKPSAVAKLDTHVKKAATLPRRQLVKLYGERVADLLAHKGYTFRAMHTHGRALFGLIPRAAGPEHETGYVVIDGEFIAGPILGWNFGDGHLHNEQLVVALQERCHFEEGEVRVVVLDAQPIQRQRQRYRLVDAAIGEFERGYVAVSDMLARQPWDCDIPAHITWSRAAANAGSNPPASQAARQDPRAV
ncbi:DUF3556 domain-containing protein [Prauserella muralis]|uniref:Uncharacterized protein n=1 Tax=Prauserella muralis TaxID=588067 RepID=A0A2V4ADX4_9PSEU|nr:DUF3556 domain-containing protein [Prauserella muralis]PXY17405.1 hypothetical protein BAY60_34515 [Prauserella muralis]TWE23573.1 transmembrane protein DUF3556 [Prauserella muralis]